MEYVSFLSGVPFSDTPACTDRFVAMVAMLVNDTVGEPRRDGLVAYASRLASCRPRTAEQRAATLESVLEVAMRHSGDAGIARRRRRAERRATRPAGRVASEGLVARTRGHLWLNGPARQYLEYAVAVVAELPADRRDQALLAMLEAAITPGRETRSSPPRATRVASARAASRSPDRATSGT